MICSSICYVIFEPCRSWFSTISCRLKFLVYIAFLLSLLNFVLSSILVSSLLTLCAVIHCHSLLQTLKFPKTLFFITCLKCFKYLLHMQSISDYFICFLYIQSTDISGYFFITSILLPQAIIGAVMAQWVLNRNNSFAPLSSRSCELRKMSKSNLGVYVKFLFDQGKRCLQRN